MHADIGPDRKGRRLSAWRSLADFRQQVSLPTWLDHIATNAITGVNASVMPRFGLPRTIHGTH